MGFATSESGTNRTTCDVRSTVAIGGNPDMALTAYFGSDGPKDGVIGRPSLWIAEDFWVLRFRLMVKRGPHSRPQASEGEAQHGPFCWTRRFSQGDECLHCE